VGVADGWLCLWSHRWNRKTEKVVYLLDVICFQCFDTVSWVAGRASSLKKIEWWGAAWLSVCSDVQTCIWPSWCHCHSLSLASVKSRLVFTFLVLAHLGSPGQRAVKCVCVYASQGGERISADEVTVRHSQLPVATHQLQQLLCRRLHDRRPGGAAEPLEQICQP